MAWQIKFDDASKKDLAKLDKQIAKRITEFLRERVASRSADEEPAFLDDQGPSDDLPTRFALSRKGQA